jgi:hypothetical protein
VYVGVGVDDVDVDAHSSSSYKKVNCKFTLRSKHDLFVVTTDCCPLKQRIWHTSAGPIEAFFEFSLAVIIM